MIIKPLKKNLKIIKFLCAKILRKGRFMLVRNVLVELILLSFFTILIFSFLKQFGIKSKKAVIFVFPLIIYSLGFYLRMTGDKNLIDLGFFFTELTTVFTTILFSICLYLGQIKYWKVKDN